VENIEQFWALVWEYTNIVASVPYTQVLEKVDMADVPKWFLGAKLNFAENLLMVGEAEKVAVIATGEAGNVRNITYSELREHVRQWAGAFKDMGIQVGDRVAAYIPNCEYALIGMLAATSIGAIWSSTSPDFGPTGVLERFNQIKPRILISVNAIQYNGKEYDHLTKVQASVQGLDSVEKVVVIPFVSSHSMDISGIPKAISMSDFLETGKDYKLAFEQLPFYHPVYILFSSGTTGTPKCLVHSGGGTLIQHKKELMIHSSISPNDVFFYYTTTGWMMWNWLVSALSTGCTIVMYDGSPFKPNNNILWQLAQDLKFTVFGTSAKYIQSCQEFGLHPGKEFDLSSLHTIFSTGSPLSPECFEWVYDEVKKNVLLGSISGGTDIVSLFVGHNSALPVYKGEIQCRCLGMAVEAWDHEGKPCVDQDADLVCVKPFPCMPVDFWGDDEKRTKYKAAYFDAYPGVWGHGDFVRINSKTGGVYMLGRR
jgi:acetoacetyl-CoA synthetase